MFEISISKFPKWSNSNSNTVVKFEEIIGFGCKNTNKEVANFNEAKAYCSENKECNWIQDKNSNEHAFEICSNDNFLEEIEDHSVYAKLEHYGKYNTSINILFWGVNVINEKCLSFY